LSLSKVITTNINVIKKDYKTVGNIGAETAGGRSVTVHERGRGGAGGGRTSEFFLAPV
jgi:hypothetical protein